MTKLFATAALLAASIAIAPAAQAKLAANGVKAGKATIQVVPAPQKRIAFNGVRMGNGVQAGKATTGHVIYVELPRR